MRAIADVMLKHPHVWILSDDIYEHLAFDGFKSAPSRRSTPELRDRIVTVNGASKAYAMTGWRVGYCGGPKDLIGRWSTCTVRRPLACHRWPGRGRSSAGRTAGRCASNRSRPMQRRRDMAVEMLNGCKGINCHKPEGAFYVFPNVAGCIGKTTAGGRKLETDHDLCMALLEKRMSRRCTARRMA